MNENLTIICEGGIHTIEYIHRHRIFPQKVLLQPLKFEEIVPYLNEDEEILVIIKGLTDFTIAEIYVLMEKLKEYEDKIKDVTILSNLKLGDVPYDYYLYFGDLFYSGLNFISDNKEYQVAKDGTPILEPKRIGKNETHEMGMKNPIMVHFTKYNDPKVKIGIYGKQEEKETENSYEEYEDKVFFVDVFSETKNNGGD